MHGEDENRNTPGPAGCHTNIAVTKCHCGAWHFRYRYLEIAIQKEALYVLMEACYQHETLLMRHDYDNHEAPPQMRFSLGVIMMTIPDADFPAFSKAIGDAVSEDMGLVSLLTDDGSKDALH